MTSQQIRSELVKNAPSTPLVSKSLKILTSAFSIFPFHSICLALNGGKDSSLILSLTLLAMEQQNLTSQPLQCIYFKESSPLPEMEEYLKRISSFPIRLIEMDSTDFKVLSFPFVSWLLFPFSSIFSLFSPLLFHFYHFLRNIRETWLKKMESKPS